MHRFARSNGTRFFLRIAIAACMPAFAQAAIVVDSGGDDAPGVPNKHCTLREAVNNVINRNQSEPDCTSGASTTDIEFDAHVVTIQLDPKLGHLQVGLGSTVVVRGPVTVTLPAGVKGANQFLVDTGSSLELDDVTLENGNDVEGGLIVADGVLSMSGGAARFGSAMFAGAIAVHDRATFSGVEFSANTARGGGALGIDSMEDVVIEDCQFFANAAIGDAGGAVSALNGFGNLAIKRTSFISNRADSAATGSGGAVYVGSHGTVSIEDSIINRNIATGPLGGAGVDFDVNAHVEIVNTEFRANKVESLKPSAVGGAFAHRGGPIGFVHVSRSNFSENLAWVGGAVYMGPGAALEIENTTLTNNFADPTGKPARPDSGSGAAVYADSATVDLRNVTVKDNDGVSQLSSHDTAELRFANTVALAEQGVLNCDGQGVRIDVASSLQNADAMGASCSLALLVGAAATVFEGPATTFDSPAGPPIAPVAHRIWLPKAGGPLSKMGDKATCLDPAFVAAVDERAHARAPVCDIGSVEEP